jgi:sulfonate transport system substrate-binding protein
MGNSALRPWSFLIAALLAGLGCGTASAQTAIRIGYPLAINAKIPLAMQKAQIDRRSGLNGEFVAFQNGPPMFEALASGSLDVVFTSILPTLVYSAKLPGDFHIVSAPGQSSSALLVGPHSTARSLADLKGRRIAVSFGTSQHMDIIKALDASHLDTKDVVLLNFAPSDLPLALENELVDAVVVFQPQIVKLKSDYGARAIETWPFYYVVGIRRAYLERNPDAERRVVTALHEAISYISLNEDQTTQWLASALKVDASTIRAVEADDAAGLGLAGTKPEAEVTPAFKDIFLNWSETAYKLGIIKSHLDSKASFN